MIKFLLLCMTMVITGVSQAALTTQQQQSVVEVRNPKKRCGTAWACDSYHLITAKHVTDYAAKGGQIYVVYKGRMVPVTVVGEWESCDTAMLQSPVKLDTPLPIARVLSVGDSVTIYGYPGGAPFSCSSGYVTNLVTPLLNNYTWRMAATTTALVRGGYSGGCVTNNAGEVVGILTNQEPHGPFTQSSGGVFTRCDQVRSVLKR